MHRVRPRGRCQEHRRLPRRRLSARSAITVPWSRPRGAGDDGVGEIADAAGRDGDSVAGPQERRWIQERPASGRGSGREDVTGLERDDRGQPLDRLWWRADLLADERVLAELAVDAGLDA